MPLHFGDIGRNHFLKEDHNININPFASRADEMPGITEIPLQRKSGQDFIATIQNFGFRYAADIKSSNRAIQRQPADQIPAASQKQDAVRADQSGDRFPLCRALILNSNLLFPIETIEQ